MFCVATPFHPPSKEKGRAGGETTAVDQPLLQAYRPAGDVVRSARVPLLYPCRYAREKLSVRESNRRCPPLAFCPKRISVGRAHHHRKRMHLIRRFRTKLAFRRNILLCCISFELSCYYYSLRSWGGFHWRDTRVAAPTAASRLLSYCQNLGAPPPQLTGRGTKTRSLWRPRPPMVANY